MKLNPDAVTLQRAVMEISAAYNDLSAYEDRLMRSMKHIVDLLGRLPAEAKEDEEEEKP